MYQMSAGQVLQAPLTNIPIGHQWQQMIAIDILEVPITTIGTCNLLFIQDYCTEGYIDQKAESILQWDCQKLCTLAILKAGTILLEAVCIVKTQTSSYRGQHGGAI